MCRVFTVDGYVSGVPAGAERAERVAKGPRGFGDEHG